VSNVELPSVSALFADVSARGLKRRRRWSPVQTPCTPRTPTAGPPATRVRNASPKEFASGCYRIPLPQAAYTPFILIQETVITGALHSGYLERLKCTVDA